MELNEIENKINKFERFIDYSVNNHLTKTEIIISNTELHDRINKLDEKMDRILSLTQKKDNYLDKRIDEQKKDILNLLMKDKVFTYLFSDEIEFYTEKVLLAIEELTK